MNSEWKEKGSVKDGSQDRQRYLVFSLAGEEYAVPLLEVKEVIGYVESTPIPYAPPYFKGVINLRGQVISVIDLRSKLNLTKAPASQERTIIILDLEPQCLGVIVDTVDRVIALAESDLSPVPTLEKLPPAVCLRNVARLDQRLILLLDLRASLGVEDRQALQSQIKQAS